MANFIDIMLVFKVLEPSLLLGSLLPELLVMSFLGFKAIVFFLTSERIFPQTHLFVRLTFIIEFSLNYVS